MREITNLERLEFSTMHLRDHEYHSIAELQEEVAKALDYVLQILKAQERMFEKLERLIERHMT